MNKITFFGAVAQNAVFTISRMRSSRFIPVEVGLGDSRHRYTYRRKQQHIQTCSFTRLYVFLTQL